MSKKIFFGLLYVLLCIGITEPILAQEKMTPAFVAPVFPIRGQENWDLPISQITNTTHLEQLVKEQLPIATYLLRFDALQDEKIRINFPDSENSEIGVLLEITSSLARQAHVPYGRENDTWYAANNIFLSGYSPDQREALIDIVMNNFLAMYGHFPKTVGAWHIDAYSAKILAAKYSVTNIVLCADQYSTDRYQLWGSWWGVPYIPTDKNILVPAQSENHRLPIVVTQWAMRDPLNGYGNDVNASTYSLQVNDYRDKSVPKDYSAQILNSYLFNEKNQFGFAMIGIENSYDINVYRQELISQFSQVRALAKNHPNLQIGTLSAFADWYHKHFQLSPAQHISIQDPLGSGKEAQWTMTNQERVFEITFSGNSQIIDHRFYYPQLPEPFYLNRNPLDHLYLNLPFEKDDISLPGSTSSWSKVMPAGNLWPYLDWRYSLLILFLILMITKFSPSKLTAITILSGTSLWELIMWRSGKLYDYGVGFWGPHGHDAVWHLAIIEHLSRSWSIDNPLLSGSQIQNYHLGYDLLQAIIFRMSHIPNVILYFHILPLFASIVIGLLTVKLISKLGGTTFSQIIALLFTYVGGSCGWLVASLQAGRLTYGAETMFWAQQAISTPINPPFMWSYAMLLAILVLIAQSYHNEQCPESMQSRTKWRNLFRGVFTSSKIDNLKSTFLYVLIGLLPLIKIYAGLLLYTALGTISLKEIIVYLKNTTKFSFREVLSQPTVKMSLISGLLSMLAFALFTRTSGGFPFIFSPGWFIQSMLYDSGRVNWPRLAQATQAYSATHLYHKWLAATLLGMGIFYIGNFWIRTLGIIFLIRESIKSMYISPKIQSHPSFIMNFSTIITISSVLVPLFFIQKGTAWNTIQFLYYTQMFLGIFTALTIGAIIRKRFFQITTIIVLLVLNIPTTIGTLSQYLPYRAPARLPVEETLALNFLKTQESGRILTMPFNEEDFLRYDEPRPLRVYTSTAYVSAFSGHPVVLEDQINLEIMGLDWQKKRNQIQRFLITQDKTWAQSWVEENHIQYFYYHQGQPFPLIIHDLGFQKIFENGLVQIYKKN